MGTTWIAEDKKDGDIQGKVHLLADRLSVFMEGFGRDVATEFCVGRDEVAILLVSDNGTMLKFVYPDALCEGNMNVFPLSSHSLAGQVIRMKRGSIVNNASQVKHLSFYEQIRMGGSPVRQIQKMISAPVVTSDGRVVGVVQVSRKGETPAGAGPDFTIRDLQKLSDLAGQASPKIERAKPPDFS